MHVAPRPARSTACWHRTPAAAVFENILRLTVNAVGWSQGVVVAWYNQLPVFDCANKSAVILVLLKF